jgi:hypothetical protein
MMILLTTTFAVCLSAAPAIASGTQYASTQYASSMEYECTEIERVSVAAAGMMQPAYPGRQINFTLDGDKITSNGVFFHTRYDITPLGGDGFRGFAEDAQRTDIFRLENNVLFHSAIVHYGDEPSIQSQVFSCRRIA